MTHRLVVIQGSFPLGCDSNLEELHETRFRSQVKRQAELGDEKEEEGGEVTVNQLE